MKKEERVYRMYGLVPYNISPIQQAIQYGHAVVEYGLKFSQTEEYQKWAKKDKTFIILNGGTTNVNPGSLGTLNNHKKTLWGMGVPYADFFEPDLGDQLTAVVFLMDERVWDRLTYPELSEIGDEHFESPQERMLIEMYRKFLDQFRLA